MHYSSSLETLESFWNPLCMGYANRVGALVILYPLLRLVVLGIAHDSQQCALFSLNQLLSMPYRWITQVL